MSDNPTFAELYTNQVSIIDAAKIMKCSVRQVRQRYEHISNEILRAESNTKMAHKIALQNVAHSSEESNYPETFIEIAHKHYEGNDVDNSIKRLILKFLPRSIQVAHT